MNYINNNEIKLTNNNQPPLFSLIFSQGAKIIQSFLWYLNPRQVFDLSQAGPQDGSVPACGILHLCVFVIRTPLTAFLSFSSTIAVSSITVRRVALLQKNNA